MEFCYRPKEEQNVLLAVHSSQYDIYNMSYLLQKLVRLQAVRGNDEQNQETKQKETRNEFFSKFQTFVHQLKALKFKQPKWLRASFLKQF